MLAKLRRSLKGVVSIALAVLLAGSVFAQDFTVGTYNAVHKLVGAPVGSCSAVMIAPSRALTAAHCLVLPNLTLEINGVDYPVSGSYVVQEGADLAMLIVPSAPCPCAVIKSALPDVYSGVYVVGYPHGLMRVVTLGLYQGQYDDPETLQRFGVTDARAAPGNSGGGVFSAQGELLGILSATNGHLAVYVELAGLEQLQ